MCPKHEGTYSEYHCTIHYTPDGRKRRRAVGSSSAHTFIISNVALDNMQLGSMRLYGASVLLPRFVVDVTAA
jgi:hypothetical protein